MFFIVSHETTPSFYTLSNVAHINVNNVLNRIARAFCFECKNQTTQYFRFHIIE